MGCKVDTLVQRHGLTVPDPGYGSVDEFLVARWTGSDGRSAEGYKSLTEWFNKRLLKRRYEAAGRDAVSVHLDRDYEVIVGEADVDRDELAADLATDGLDVDDLREEFVSWSTMRHHLKGCLDAEKETRSATTDWETESVAMARERTEEKARSVLSSLASKARLPNADRAEVEVQVKLTCPECSVRVPFEEAVDRGYVCETHLDAERDENETSKVRWTNALTTLVAPCAALEAVQTLPVDQPLLFELLPLAF
ncbi:MAG: rod-determining factor RdfA [Haloplanus sp.]